MPNYLQKSSKTGAAASLWEVMSRNVWILLPRAASGVKTRLASRIFPLSAVKGRAHHLIACFPADAAAVFALTVFFLCTILSSFLAMRSTSWFLAILSGFLSVSSPPLLRWKPPLMWRKNSPRLSLSLFPPLHAACLSPSPPAAAWLSFVVVCHCGTPGVVVFFWGLCPVSACSNFAKTFKGDSAVPH